MRFRIVFNDAHDHAKYAEEYELIAFEVATRGDKSKRRNGLHFGFFVVSAPWDRATVNGVLFDRGKGYAELCAGGLVFRFITCDDCYNAFHGDKVS